MSFTYVNTANNQDSTGSSITQLDIAAYSTTAGSLLVGWCKHEGAATTLSVARSDTTEPWTADTYQSHSNNDLNGRFFYLIGSGGGTQTYRLTLAAARPWVSFILFEYTFTGGTPALDGTPVRAQGNSAAPNSGNATTTGTDGLAFGGYGEYTANQASAGLINGVAADGGVYLSGVPSNFSAAWRKTYSAGFTGAASCTGGASAPWLCHFLAFSIGGGGGGGPVGLITNRLTGKRPRGFAPGLGR